MSSTLSFLNPTQSSTSVDPSSTDSAFLAFTSTPNASVCGSDLLSWEYAGNISNTLALGVTNDGVDGASSGKLVTQLLHTFDGSISTVNSYKWSPVSLPAGAYAAVISISETSQLFYSQTFYVADSDDHTCLGSSSSSSNSATTTSSTTALLPFTSSAGSGSTDLPTESAMRAGTPRGVIASIVVGVTALFVVLSGAFFILFRHRPSCANVFGAVFKRKHRLLDHDHTEKRQPGLGTSANGDEVLTVGSSSDSAPHYINDHESSNTTSSGESNTSPELMSGKLAEHPRSLLIDVGGPAACPITLSRAQESQRSTPSSPSIASDPFRDPPLYGE